MLVPSSYLLLMLQQCLWFSATVVSLQKCHTFLSALLTYFSSMNWSTESEVYYTYLFLYIYKIYIFDLFEMYCFIMVGHLFLPW